MNEREVRGLHQHPDYDIIEEMKRQLIQTFEALPDYVATEVFFELKERGLL